MLQKSSFTNKLGFCLQFDVLCCSSQEIAIEVTKRRGFLTKLRAGIWYYQGRDQSQQMRNKTGLKSGRSHSRLDRIFHNNELATEETQITVHDSGNHIHDSLSQVSNMDGNVCYSCMFMKDGNTNNYQFATASGDWTNNKVKEQWGLNRKQMQKLRTAEA